MDEVDGQTFDGGSKMFEPNGLLESDYYKEMIHTYS